MFDTLIVGGRIVDGTGNPWFYGDVAITGEQISAIAPPDAIPHENAKEVVDASGMIVCPGFIDILSHSIITLMTDYRCVSKITQGVTTEIMGEGWCPAPYGGEESLEFLKSRVVDYKLEEWIERLPNWNRWADWLDTMTEIGVTPNVGSFMGGGTVRRNVMGMAMGKPTTEQMTAMQNIMAEAMEDGAMGVSQAIIYPPTAYADTNELVKICDVVSRYHGLYITHIRSEADELLEGLDEAIEIGKRAKLPVEIYHLKAAGKRNWHKLEAVIERINSERAAGFDITADIYPYPAMGTGLSAILPPWTAADSKFFDNLRDPVMREKVRAETLAPSGGWEALADLVGPENIMPVGLRQLKNQQYVGVRLTEIAKMRNQEWFDSVVDLFLSEEQRIASIFYSMDEDNVRTKLQQPWITIGTDAGGFDPIWALATGPTHPRGYGSFTRILGRYVRDEKVISLEDAVRKMSGAAAQRLSIRDRGLLREELQADVVIFDPETIADHATFEEPHQLSTGVRDVWVNGTRALEDGKHLGTKSGQFVKGPGAQ